MKAIKPLNDNFISPIGGLCPLDCGSDDYCGKCEGICKPWCR
ncbi:hypothetical protein PV797_17200 [Clostridiaceae bacterium M8S5]|nr:hypothetical protein PV797_17200 [Clostridiaceae bacterium M8S5]